MHTLRGRLVLSHVLPILLIIPLLGLALIYVIETQVLIPDLSRELAGEAQLAARMAGVQPRLWDDPAEARQFLHQVSQGLASRVMLLTPEGLLLASSDTGDAGRLGSTLDAPGLAEAAQGRLVVRTSYSQGMQAEIVDVFAPVQDAGGRVVGLVRLSQRYTTVAQEFLRLRYLIAGVLFLGLLGGVALGWWIAVTLSRPLQRAAQAVYDLALGERGERLPVQGPLELRQLAQAVNHLVERLRLLETGRQRLLANLVHELGRPLGAIHAGLQTLLRGARSDPRVLEELLSGIDDQVLRLDHLLDDLSHLHGQVLGPLELQRQPIEVAGWLEQALVPWRQAAAARKLSLELRVPPGLPTLEADPLRLEQALGNLLSNAVKFTPPGGQIGVAAGAEAGWLWMAVQDSGPGIPHSEQDQIFTPFYRGAQSGRIPQGMGLGLSSARDMVEAHGGALEVRSEAGQGSEFTIRLPLRRPAV